jgi:L-fuculose-phosphate aldolase
LDLERSLFNQFRQIGRDLFLRGLVNSHAGNMSVRVGGRMFITRRGSMLGRLRRQDIVDVEIDLPSSHILLASSEIGVHRKIYKETSSLSIIHAHPPFSVLLSFFEDELLPRDSEGSYVLKRVPIVAVEKTVGAEEAATAVAEALRDYKVVIMRGHGSFARGEILEEAYMLTTALESSAFYLFYMREGAKEFRRFAERYKDW